MSYGQNKDYDTTQDYTGSDFDSSAQRGRNTDEYGQPRGGQQARDPLEQQRGAAWQGTDPASGLGQEGAQTRRGAADEGYGNEGQYGQQASGERPGMMEKLKGTAEKMAGKMHHSEHGQARQEGRSDSGAGY